MSICLYCPNPPDSIDHPLPAAFGEFEDAPLLEDRICTPCNNKRLGVLDEQLSRCGPEAVFRRFFGVQGRTTHDPVNPHYRGSAGGGRLRMKAFDTSVGLDVELECHERQVRQCRQIVFVERFGKTHQLLIQDHFRNEPEKLRAAYLELGVVQPADARILYDPNERAWIEPLIKAVWPSASLVDLGLAATNYEHGAVVELRLTDRYFRALAKIGFHYFLAQFPSFTGSEPCFSPIREFISVNARGIDQINDFVEQRGNPLLTPMMDGAVPNGWMGHVVCAEIRDECLAHVQLFVCQEFSAPVYTVRLSANSDRHAIGATGHIYRYFDEGPKGRFAGYARKLMPTRVAPALPAKRAVG